MKKNKATALAIAMLMGISTILNGIPVTVFAQENMEIVNENITDNTNEATKSGEETNIDENTDIVVEDVSPSTENSIIDEQPVISEEKETQTSEKSEIKATAVKVSNGIEGSDWNIVSETDTGIVLGEYIGSSKDIVVPSEIDGKQVFIDRFKTKFSPEVTSVIFLSQNGKKTKIKGDFSQFFYRYEDLKKVDFNGLDLSDVTSLTNLFGSCSSLTEINGLDNLDISNINDISFMFSGCTSLKNIEFLKNWDVSNLKNFSSLFNECESLEDLTPLKNWNTSKAEDFGYMFAYCESLRDITPIQNWDVSNVISMMAMFRQCSSLKNIDLSMWNPISLERADMLFQGIGKISDTLFVNLSQWNLENVNIENIFLGLGNSSYKILVVTDDEKLKNYDYKGRYMSGNSMTFFATGGKFDTNIEKKVSTPIYTIPDTSDSTVNSIVENIKKEIGIPIKEEYQFSGWSSNVADTNNIVELLNQVCNANWKINTYKVNFESQGGSNVTGQTVEFNGLIQKPIAPVKPGFTFLGWYKEAECLTKWNFQTDRMPANNMTLYAKWIANDYTIKFDANTGVGNMADLAMKYDTPANLPANAFTKEGYTFNGWNTEADGTGTAYADNASVNNLTADTNGEVTLYAQWSTNSYTIHFDGNGGNGTMPDQVMVYDVATALNLNTFTRDGYTFKGWNVKTRTKKSLFDVIARNVTYTDGQSVKNLVSQANGEITLVAVWEANDYTIKFEANGGTGTMADQAMKYDQAENLTKNEYTKEGHTFKGWATTPDGNVVYADEVEVKNLTNKANESITLYAVWEINSYDVTFDSQGGSTVDGKTIEYNALVEKPTNPTREGYTFGGWYKEAECATVWDFDTDKMPAGNLTLYAKWILNASELNHAPTINATDKVLTVGDTFNPLEGVTAFDDEDGAIALTEANIIANDVNTDKAGTYNITYKVTDSQGATVVKTITVTVNEKPTIPDSKPENKPSNPNQNSSKPSSLPQTGDATNLGLLGLMFAGSGSMLLVLNRKKRKGQKKER